MSKPERVMQTYYEVYGNELREFQAYETANYVVELDRWGLAGRAGSRAMHSKREVFTSAAHALAYHIMRNKNRIVDFERRIQYQQDEIRRLEDMAIRREILPDVVARLTEYEEKQRSPRHGE